jgi:hypothetical protein
MLVCGSLLAVAFVGVLVAAERMREGEVMLDNAIFLGGERVIAWKQATKRKGD